MRIKISICFLVLSSVLSCKEQQQYQSWSCLQTNQINEDVKATHESIIVYSTPQSAKSSGTVVINNQKLNKSSVLKSELSFSRSDSGKNIEMTLLSKDLNIIKDELDLFSDGRAEALLPDIGSSISGKVIYEKDRVRRIQYENGEMLECTFLND